MSTHPDTTIAPAPGDLRRDRIAYGAVHLDVIDLRRSLAFWRDLIGLGELPSAPGEARLGVEDRALIVLRPGAVRPAARGSTGLYHVAIHLPNAREFARILVRLAVAGVPQSPTDHIFSEATYLHDPDGILLELTLETPERYGSMEIGPRTVDIFDSEGRRRGPTEPLDVAAAIAPLAGGEPQGPMPSGSYVGHVHLHVADLEAAYGFYRDVVGFDEHAYMAGIGMADLSAGGDFPHRIALNDWHGSTARQAPAGTAGMRSYELIVRDGGQLDAIAGRAAAAGLALPPAETGALAIDDPAGNRVTVFEATT